MPLLLPPALLLLGVAPLASAGVPAPSYATCYNDTLASVDGTRTLQLVRPPSEPEPASDPLTPRPASRCAGAEPQRLRALPVPHRPRLVRRPMRQAELLPSGR